LAGIVKFRTRSVRSPEKSIETTQGEEIAEMTPIRSLVIAIAAVAALAATAGDAAAWGGKCNGPFCNQGAYPSRTSLFGGHGNMPVYQAAPWYLYWPYDGHFLTPAPVTGAFYGPPTAGNFPVNPYFPHPAYGGYGPIPGGPPPRP
jgi:hypothetical protein